MARRRWWQTPSLRHDEEHSRHRPVTWLELFFDLFLVVAVSQLSHQLSQDVTWGGLRDFVAQFLPLFWVWLGITYYQERFETEGLENRLILFTAMLCVAGLAVFAHHGLHQNFDGFVMSYAAGRTFTLGLWMRAAWHEPRFRAVARWYALGFGLGQACAWASVAVGDVPARYVLMGCALAADVVTPLLALPDTRRLPRVSSSKHPERFGLFTLIVLGETVVGVVSGLAGGTGEAGLLPGVAAVLGVLLGFGMWWVYFDYVGRRPFRPSPYVMYAWSYLHFGMFLAIVATGAGVLDALQAMGAGDLPGPVRWLTAGAVGAFLAAVGLMELLLVRRHDEPTHPVVSPALKLATAPVAAGLGALPLSAVPLLLGLLAVLSVHVAYATWTWFTQDLADAPPAH